MKLPLKDAWITSPYNVVRTINGKTKTHKGIDMISSSGSKLVSAVKGGIYRGKFYDANGFGTYVSIQHDDGIRTIYAHLSAVALDNNLKGQRIAEGTLIGIEGSSGASTGVHLHIEARKSPYLSTNRIDIAEYLGIENEKGTVKETAKRKAMRIVQEKTGFNDSTMKYLNDYKFSEDLFIKLEKAIEEG